MAPALTLFSPETANPLGNVRMTKIQLSLALVDLDCI